VNSDCWKIYLLSAPTPQYVARLSAFYVCLQCAVPCGYLVVLHFACASSEEIETVRTLRLAKIVDSFFFRFSNQAAPRIALCDCLVFLKYFFREVSTNKPVVRMSARWG